MRGKGEGQRKQGVEKRWIPLLSAQGVQPQDQEV